MPDKKTIHDSFISTCVERLAVSRYVCVLFLIGASACQTIGVQRSHAGYNVVSASVGAEMMLDSPDVVVVDVRPHAEYDGPQGHIAGAISAPFHSIERHLPELLPYQKATVIVYGATTNDGATGAELLSAAGFRSVVLLSGGLSDWLALGYRTVGGNH